MRRPFASTLITAASILLWSPVTAQERAPAFTKVEPSIQLELFLAHEFPAIPNHKAVAIGPAGTFGIATHQASAKRAASVAIANCEQKLVWHPLTHLRHAKCEILENTTIQKSTAPLKPKDKTGSQKILIHLPDCTTRAAANSRYWRNSWHDYFAVRGFTVKTIHPAQGSACPRSIWQHDASVKERRRRLHETLKAIATTHRGSEITLWGDGIGADVIHASILLNSMPGTVKVITTDAPCAFSTTRQTHLSSKIHHLAFVGTKSFHLERIAKVKGAYTIGEYCQIANAARPNATVVPIATKAQFPLWNRTVSAALASFVVEPEPTFPFAEAAAYNGTPYYARKQFNRAYRWLKRNRAMVLSPRGRVFYSGRHPAPETAVNAALYKCNRAHTGNGFNTATSGLCIKYAINRKIIFKRPRRKPQAFAASQALTQSKTPPTVKFPNSD